MRVVGNNQVLITDTCMGHSFGKTSRGRNLRFNSLVRIDNISGPVDIDSVGNMPLRVFFRCTCIGGLLFTTTKVNGTYVTAHIHNAYSRVVEMLREPGGLYQKLTAICH